MTNHPYTEIALLEGKLKAANDLLSTQGRLLRQAVEELDVEVKKLKAAEAEIYRRGECMEEMYSDLYLLSGTTVTDNSKYDALFDEGGYIIPWGYKDVST